jgi:3-hydroxyacyl-[acyl-carrier-protein] dehydratase
MMKFRMVDRILAWEPRRTISGVKTVSFEEYSLKSQLGGGEGLPETLVLEALYQLAGWLVMLSSDFAETGLAARTGRVSFDEPLRPGRIMLLDVRVRRYREGEVVFDAEARSEGRRIATAERFISTRVPSTDYFDPADLRVLSEELIRPAEGDER